LVKDHSEFELTDDVFAVLVQYPSGNGEVNDFKDLFDDAHSKEIFTIVGTKSSAYFLSLIQQPERFGSPLT
jgi:glycine dehydrogenase